jgi:S-adenosylmethionine:tRNA ribosyltransferase-isomerase
VKLAELQYELPRELVATHPASRRDQARLLCVGAAPAHRRVSDLVELLPEGALLVVNDTRVIPARLFGTKESGGKVELLLVRQLGSGPSGEQRWSALAKASRRVKAGTNIDVAGRLLVHVAHGADHEGMFTVSVSSKDDHDVKHHIDAVGHMPLPPYIARSDEPADRERYQTRFARVDGAVAAPTAGLHFSDALIETLRSRGHGMTSITLHVGPGTFRPVAVEELDDHPMHAEAIEVSADAANAIAETRDAGAPVVAVGTTVVRALESCANDDGTVRVTSGETRLMIQPGYQFRVVDALLTNFHLPGSTLLALVYAFGGTERIRAAYDTAIAERYRFYSYGDAMFIRSPTWS